MGSQAIFHGRITLRSSARDAMDVIRRFTENVSYPWITEEAFSSPSSRNYRDEVLGFALTRKYSEWRDYLIQFECLLAQLNFDVAKAELETEFEGTFHWYWQRKPYDYPAGSIAEYELIETPLWYFGQGVRNMWGHHLDGYNTFPVPMDFHYPIVFAADALKTINDHLPELNKIPVGQEITFDDLRKITGLKQNNHLHDILNYLAGRGLIKSDHNKENGAWIERLERLAPLKPVMLDNLR